MSPKARRRPRSRVPAAPILIIPKQTHDEIERRQRIRESAHDATAVTVRAIRRARKKAS
jgi:hypothetical protein